jgi:hypothetical protein
MPPAQHAAPANLAPPPQQQPRVAPAEAARLAVVVVVGMTMEGVMGGRLTGGGATRGEGAGTTGLTAGTGAAGAWTDMETRSNRSSVSHICVEAGIMGGGVTSTCFYR